MFCYGAASTRSFCNDIEPCESSRLYKERSDERGSGSGNVLYLTKGTYSLWTSRVKQESLGPSDLLYTDLDRGQGGHAEHAEHAETAWVMEVGLGRGRGSSKLRTRSLVFWRFMASVAW